MSGGFGWKSARMIWHSGALDIVPFLILLSEQRGMSEHSQSAALSPRAMASSRVQPLVAMRAMRELLNDPDDTAQVFKIIQALKGNSIQQAVKRMYRSVTGRQLMQARPDIIPVLNDREALAAMPEGSLGRAYLAFVEARDLSADGLVAASEEAPERPLPVDEQWVGLRLRDIHDLQHVLTGYRTDELGELCLLEFMCTQTYNRGIRFIIFMAKRKFCSEQPALPVKACVKEARRIAQQAAWTCDIPWESRLAESLDDIRREMNLQPPALYLSVRDQFISERDRKNQAA